MTDRNSKSSIGKISQNAMNEILQGKVKQTPKWYFVAKNIILWFIGGLCVVAGALTVSLIIFTFANSALFMRGVPHMNFVRHLIVILPLLWIIFASIFVILFDILVRHTKQGYKYSLVILIAANAVLSIAIGTIFYSCGISYVVDDILSHLHYYHSVESRQARMFDVPEEGIIVGRVIGCNNEYFTLVTPRGYKWYVMYENIPNLNSKDIIDGQIFMISGKKIDEDIFVACKIHKHGMRGDNPNVRNRHIKKIQKIHRSKEQICTCEKMSDNIRQIVHSACVQVQ